MRIVSIFQIVETFMLQGMINNLRHYIEQSSPLFKTPNNLGHYLEHLMYT